MRPISVPVAAPHRIGDEVAHRGVALRAVGVVGVRDVVLGLGQDLAVDVPVLGDDALLQLVDDGLDLRCRRHARVDREQAVVEEADLPVLVDETQLAGVLVELAGLDDQSRATVGVGDGDGRGEELVVVPADDEVDAGHRRRDLLIVGEAEVREDDDDLGALAAQGRDGGVRGRSDVGAHDDRRRPRERITRDGQAHDADLDAADLLDQAGTDPVAEGRVAAEIEVGAEEREGPDLREGHGEDAGAEVELVVADDHRVQAELLEDRQLGDAEVGVEEQVAVEGVAAVQHQAVGLGGADAAGHGREAGQAAQRALEVGVLRPEAVDVGVCVVDVEHGDRGLGGEPAWKGQAQEGADQP